MNYQENMNKIFAKYYGENKMSEAIIESVPKANDEEYLAEIRCDNNHTQQLKYVGVSKEFVELNLGLIDGSSSAYLSKPDCRKCELCGANIKGKIIS